MQIRYLFLFRGQQSLIKFLFLWVYEYFSTEERTDLRAREVLSKQSQQLYKKYAIKLKPWAKQLFIAAEMEVERLVKRYGIRNSKPDEKFIKAVQKAAAAKGMTVAEYKDNILFPHGKEKILARFKKFYKLQQKALGI